jgi:hypothetical protein
MPFKIPELHGHNILYKGRRYWVIEIDTDHPFETLEEDYTVIVFDKLYDEPVAFCDANLNGYVSCGGLLHNVPVYGINPRALAREVSMVIRNLRNYS